MQKGKNAVINDFVIHKNVLLEYKKHTDSEVIVPEGIEVIATKAFFQHREIRSIQLPNTLCKIEEYAFDFCKELETITINSSNLEIEKEAFSHCNIKRIDLSNCSKVGSKAFAYNPLYFVSLGNREDPNRFEEGAFAEIRPSNEDNFEICLFYDQSIVNAPILFFDCYADENAVKKWMTTQGALKSNEYFVVAKDKMITNCSMLNASTWLRMMCSVPTYITNDFLNTYGQQLTILDLFNMLSIIIRKNRFSPDRHTDCYYYIKWLNQINYDLPNKTFAWLTPDSENDDYVFERFYLIAVIAILHQVVQKWNATAIKEYCAFVGTEKIKHFMSILVSSIELLLRYNKKRSTHYKYFKYTDKCI